MELRDYQKEAVKAILGEWENGKRKTLLVLPTGMGKTICFAEITKEMAAKGKRVLIIAHRKELLDQAMDKMEKFGVPAAMELGNERAGESPVVISSVQTMIRRFKNFAEDHFSVVIIDEAHHIMAKSYQKILEYFKKADVLGVTATPERGDKTDLGKFFDSVAYEYSLKKAMEDGWLCPVKIMETPISISLESVYVHAGDFDAEETARAIIPSLRVVAAAMKEYCKGRKHIAVFLPNVVTAESFSKILNEKGFHAASISCLTKKAQRKEILSDFKEGKYNVICNAMLLTEGWDFPALDCIINLRPTRSRTLYFQIIGRGTRLCKGKENLLIPEFTWKSHYEDIIRPWNLITRDEKVMAKMEELLSKRKSLDILKAESLARKIIKQEEEKEKARKLAEEKKRLEHLKEMEELKKEREEEARARREILRKALEEERKNKEEAEAEEKEVKEKIRIFQQAKLIDLLEYMTNASTYINGYVPKARWEKSPMTYAQYMVLHKNGIPTRKGMSKGLASRLIDTIIKRDKHNFSTPKQIRILRKFGFDATKWSKKTASKFITMIARNNWNTPSCLEKYMIPVK